MRSRGLRAIARGLATKIGRARGVRAVGVDPLAYNGRDPGGVAANGLEVAMSEPVTIKASTNGPLLVDGPVRVTDATGQVLHQGDRASLCRCGRSERKPFCDGTHARVGFVAG
jgi:hypothetical protein